MSGQDKMHFRIFTYCFIVSAIFSILVYTSTVFAEGAESPNFQKSLKITDSKIHFSSGESSNFVSCMGTIQNSSTLVWEELVIEVQYYNKENDLIDTITEYNYGLVVPANDAATFRIRDTADKNESEYYSHKVRITSARTDSYTPPRTQPRRTKSKPLTQILISWTPMLILIAVWIIFMRKYSGKNSPQRATMGILKDQVELIKEQNSLFKNLIEVIANHTAKIENKDK